MRPMDKATADSRSVQSFAVIKETGHGNFVIGRFQTRARNGLSVWDWPVYSRPLTDRHPFADFSERRGRLYTSQSQTNNPSSNWRIKSGGLFIPKLKPFHFKIKTVVFYLTRIIKRITHLTRIIRLWCENGHFCYKRMSRLGLELGVLKLTIDISMHKIILEMEYFIESMIYQMLKFFKRIAYFIPRWSEDLYFDLKIQKIQVN